MGSVSSCVRHHHPIMHSYVAVIAVIGFACNTANSYDGEFGHRVGNGGATGGLRDAQDYSIHEAFEDHSDTVSSDISLGDSLVTVDGWHHKRSPHHHKRSPHHHKRSPHHHKRNKSHKRKHRKNKHN